MGREPSGSTSSYCPWRLGGLSRPNVREPLKPYASDAEARALALLSESLQETWRPLPEKTIREKLLAYVARDVSELLPQLDTRAEEAASAAVEKLRLRGEREAIELHETLERQQTRVREALTVHERDFEQLVLDFADDERRQLETNMRSWRTRLEQFEHDRETEPDRIRDFYKVRAHGSSRSASSISGPSRTDEHGEARYRTSWHTSSGSASCVRPGWSCSAPALVRGGAILDRRDADGQLRLAACLETESSTRRRTVHL